MRGWWRELGALVLPTPCAGCGAGHAVLCEDCRRALGAGPARRVRPAPEPAGLPPVYAAAAYAGSTRAVLLAHKERGALSLAGPLGRALARSVHAAGPPAGGRVLTLVPVPSARSAVARRGHDPVRRIALAAAGRLRREGLAVGVRCALRQTRDVADQAGLNAADRRANMAGALGARPRELTPGEPVLLVDDLVTTGVSLAEAARAVRACGGEVRGAAVIAGPPIGWSSVTRG
jgi:predicted amidophosphoribosyltransferase